jgi:DNA-binding NarL/FixJ family response regulator
MSAESISPVRVVVVDDQAVVRSGLRMILDSHPDIEVVGEAADGRSGVELVEREDPDVVLMDIRMPVMNGIEATSLLRRRNARGAVLVLTTYAVDENIYEALHAGAAGFFSKTDDPATIIDAVLAAGVGDVALGAQAMQLVLDRFLAAPPVVPTPLVGFDRLTEREREVVMLAAVGRSNAEIAAELFIGEATVKTHVMRALAKLSLRDRIQLVVACHEHGLISRD